MKTLIQQTGLILMATFFIGCVDSPILNHADAAPAEQQLAVESICPIAFTEHNLCASLTWVKQATDSETGEFTLKFWDKTQGSESGPYVTPALTPFVKLWMPSMGHGSSPVHLVATLDAAGAATPGVFSATNVYFIMPGKWEIWVQLKQDAQVIAQAKLDVEI